MVGNRIRVAISHYMAIPLDMITRLVVLPASVSALSLSDYAPELFFTNFRGTPPILLNGRS